MLAITPKVYGEYTRSGVPTLVSSIEQAPGFDKDYWPSPDSQFALEVYKYYGRVPHWEQE
jgi:hypothetical protein